MPRLYIPSIPQGQRTVRILGDEARYLLAVLRMKTGEKLELFDSSGSRFRAEIKQAGKNAIVVELQEALQPAREPARRLILLQGILKGQKMDFVVQKASELGVSGIVPLVAERSQVRQTGKRERWRKIAVEASRQSCRSSVPEVEEPVAFEKFFEGKGPMEGFIFWEEGGSSLRGVKPEISEKPLFLAIGPEGGFTAAEVKTASGRGLEVKSLGERILRAETAAVSAVTLVQFLLDEMG